MEKQKQIYQIAIVGVGTVGGAVVEMLLGHHALIAKRAGVEIKIKWAIVRDAKKYAHLPFRVSERLDDALDDEEVSLIVELVGGVEYPFEIARRAFQKGKGVVSANKAMLAAYMQEILAFAKGLPLGFEASVCGGIPIIQALRDSLAGNEILDLSGIMNGTSNFILTQMQEHHQDFQTALTQAQKLGYAEADPTLDIDGGDAGHKLLILAKLAYGIEVKEEEILIEGIREIGLEDILMASKLGYSIKLLGIAKKEENQIELRVHPAFVPKQNILSDVNGVYNALSVRGDGVGEMFYCGLGAGGSATASAVVADIINIARLRDCKPYPLPPLGSFTCNTHFSLKSKEEIACRYYLKLKVLDQSGVLAQITALLAEHQISISQLLQEDQQKSARIVILTHKSEESKIDQALRRLATFTFILEYPSKIRLYE